MSKHVENFYNNLFDHQKINLEVRSQQTETNASKKLQVAASFIIWNLGRFPEGRRKQSQDQITG